MTILNPVQFKSVHTDLFWFHYDGIKAAYETTLKTIPGTNQYWAKRIKVFSSRIQQGLWRNSNWHLTGNLSITSLTC